MLHVRVDCNLRFHPRYFGSVIGLRSVCFMVTFAQDLPRTLCCHVLLNGLFCCPPVASNWFMAVHLALFGADGAHWGCSSSIKGAHCEVCLSRYRETRRVSQQVQLGAHWTASHQVSFAHTHSLTAVNVRISHALFFFFLPNNNLLICSFPMEMFCVLVHIVQRHTEKQFQSLCTVCASVVNPNSLFRDEYIHKVQEGEHFFSLKSSFFLMSFYSVVCGRAGGVCI